MKCTICEKEFNNLNAHMRMKHQIILPQNTAEPDPRYATKEDINGINSSLEKLAGLLEKKVDGRIEPAFAIKSPAQKLPELEKDSEQPDKSPIPPKYRAMVDEILGPDFGINVVYPDQGAGFLFKIIVPLEKSNADKTYLQMYKADIRTKSLSYNEGIEGIKLFCEHVKKNLQKNNSKLV